MITVYIHFLIITTCYKSLIFRLILLFLRCLKFSVQFVDFVFGWKDRRTTSSILCILICAVCYSIILSFQKHKTSPTNHPSSLWYLRPSSVWSLCPRTALPVVPLPVCQTTYIDVNWTPCTNSRYLSCSFHHFLHVYS